MLRLAGWAGCPIPPQAGWGTDRSDDRPRTIAIDGAHPIDEDLFDLIVPEGPQTAIAGDHQEVNATPLIVSTELARHPFGLPDSGSVPHPACGGMGHPRTTRLEEVARRCLIGCVFAATMEGPYDKCYDDGKQAAE